MPEIIKNALCAPIQVSLIRGISGSKGMAVQHEATDAQRLNGEKNVPAQEALMMSSLFKRRLPEMSYDQRVQSLEAINLLIRHNPDYVNLLVLMDRRIRIVEIPQDRFIDKHWREFPLPIYGMCYLASESSVFTPCSGIMFSIGTGDEILPCVSLFRSFRNSNAKAACKVFRKQPILMVHDILRGEDCPPLIRMLTRARQPRI